MHVTHYNKKHERRAFPEKPRGRMIGGGSALETTSLAEIRLHEVNGVSRQRKGSAHSRLSGAKSVVHRLGRGRNVLQAFQRRELVLVKWKGRSNAYAHVRTIVPGHPLPYGLSRGGCSVTRDCKSFDGEKGRLPTRRPARLQSADSLRQEIVAHQNVVCNAAGVG